MGVKCYIVEPAKEEGKTDHWVRKDTGEILNVSSHWDLPVGAMFYATWLEGVEGMCGSDGKSIAVVTPGGVWFIDSRASNCALPDDNTHKCWCRHGEMPGLTVDKNGNTCAAGSGSIIIGEYHGYLINGELT